MLKNAGKALMLGMNASSLTKALLGNAKKIKAGLVQLWRLNFSQLRKGEREAYFIKKLSLEKMKGVTGGWGRNKT